MKFLKTPITLFLSLFLVFSCAKEESVEQGTPGTGNPGGGGASSTPGWSYSGPNATNYGGCIDTAYYELISGIKTLNIEAFDSANNFLSFTLIAMTGNFTPGTYAAPQNAVLMLVTASGGTYMSTAANSFTMQVTTINDTLLVGTFTANLSDPISGGSYTITNGKIRALIGKPNTCGTTTGGGGGGGGGGGSAIFNLTGSQGDCSTLSLNGGYFKNTALTSMNKVTLEVSVSTAGTWNVSTNTINGFKFSGSGNFPTAGLQSITLLGEGTPAATGPTTFPVSTGTSNCSFTVPVDSLAAPCNPTNNTANFSVAGIGPITFYSNTTTPSGGSYQIVANGNNGDLTLEFAGTSQPTPGIYNIQSVSGSFAPGDVRVSMVAGSIYWQSSTGNVYVTIVNGKVVATFCNVSFSGSLGGPSYTTLASAKITQQ